MKGLNQVTLIGNLGKDPEVTYTPSGKAVAKLSIATAESWKDTHGDKVERVEWHRVIVWEKLAELAGEYLKKGRQVYISGKLQTRSWEDSVTHEKKYATEIIGRELLFLGGGGSAPAAAAPAARPAAAPAPVRDYESATQITDDDIPF